MNEKERIEKAIQWYQRNRNKYEDLSKKAKNILVELIKDEGINIHHVNQRTKELSSFEWKIESWRYDNPEVEITDLSWVRIICYVEDDIKKIAKLLKDNFTIDETNSIDKSKLLWIDKVWYKSHHYIVEINHNRLKLPEYRKFKWMKCEIQVRTILQHAWAEIEHDRSYKFSWDLPVWIDRTFKLLAWTLEVVDDGFNNIAKEIDKLSKKVARGTERWKLDYDINSTTLKQFLKTKFNALIPQIIKPIFWPNNSVLSDIIEELYECDITTLDDLNNIIPDDFEKNIRECQREGNFAWIIRHLLIISNAKKYFSRHKIWWTITSLEKHRDFFKAYGVNVGELIKKYG